MSSTGDVSSGVLIQLTDAGTPVSISSLQIDTVTTATSASRIVIMCTSSKPARLYHFVGQLILCMHNKFVFRFTTLAAYISSITGGPTVQKVFAAYKSSSVSSTELPSFNDGDHSSKPVEVHLQSTTRKRQYMMAMPYISTQHLHDRFCFSMNGLVNVSQSVSGSQQSSRTFAVLTDMGIYQGSLQPSASTG